MRRVSFYDTQRVIAHEAFHPLVFAIHQFCVKRLCQFVSSTHRWYREPYGALLTVAQVAIDEECTFRRRNLVASSVYVTTIVGVPCNGHDACGAVTVAYPVQLPGNRIHAVIIVYVKILWLRVLACRGKDE